MPNFRPQLWTLGAFLLLLTFAPFGTAASAAAASPSPDTPSHKQEKRERGARDMADGQIKDIKCKGRTMDMVFDAYDETLHLHADNYFKVDFSAINYTPKGTMNPCKEGKGMYARVYYYHIKGHPKEGELISVQFRK